MDWRVPRSGLEIGNPEFEWRSAAHWAHLEYKTFRRLDGDEQSTIIAHYRVSLQAEAVVAHQTALDMRARAQSRAASS